MRRPKPDLERRGSACFCLLAVVLLYAPLAGASWLARPANCCTGDYCPLPAHHQHKQHQAPAEDSSPMDCGHDVSSMASCSMSCCQNPDRPMVTPTAFVLPPLVTPASPIKIVRAIETARAIELPGSIEPLSPPPRFASRGL